MPADWVRKQTLVNAERYITDELKEYEAKIVGAEERISQLEQSLYAELIGYISEYIAQVQTNALFRMHSPYLSEPLQELCYTPATLRWISFHFQTYHRLCSEGNHH